MHFKYPVIVYQKAASLLPHAIRIPDLDNIEITLSPAQQDAINRIGIRQFLKDDLLDVLEKKDEQDEEIETPKPLEFYLVERKYDLYLLKATDKINLKKIKQDAVILVQSYDTLNACFIENKRLSLTQDRKNLVVDLPTSPADLAKLFSLKRDRHNKIIADVIHDRWLKTITDQALAAGKRHHLGPYDNWNIVDVEFITKRKSLCCAKYLPIFTRGTFAIELVAGIPLMSSAVKLTLKEVISDINNSTADAVSNISSILLSLLMGYMTMSGPGANNLGNFGAVFDNLFHKIKLKLTGSTPSRTEEDEPFFTRETLKKIPFKTLFSFMVLNMVFIQLAVDYQQMSSVTERARSMKSIYPEWLLVGAAWLNFLLNQLNDPVMIMGFLTFGFAQINEYFSSKRNFLSELNHGEGMGPLADELMVELAIDLLTQGLMDEKKEEKKEKSHSDLELGLLSDSPTGKTLKLGRNSLFANGFKKEKSSPSESMCLIM